MLISMSTCTIRKYSQCKFKIFRVWKTDFRPSTVWFSKWKINPLGINSIDEGPKKCQCDIQLKKSDKQKYFKKPPQGYFSVFCLNKM